MVKRIHNVLYIDDWDGERFYCTAPIQLTDYMLPTKSFCEGTCTPGFLIGKLFFGMEKNVDGKN